MIDSSDVSMAALTFKECRSALLLGHEHPDGDTVGSVLGLSIMLSRRGVAVKAAWSDSPEIPQKYRFLPGGEFVVGSDELRQNSIVVALDCANIDRLDMYRDLITGAEVVINIDHHPDNTRFGTINLVDPGAAATTEILYDIAGRLGLDVCAEAASCLYAGMVTDTGRFQFSNTTSGTLRAAADMIDKGVDFRTVYENIYQNDSHAYMKLTGRILSESSYDRGTGLVHAAVRRVDLADLGVRMEETEDLIDNLRVLGGHRIAAVFKEMADGRIRVSLRSRDGVDAGDIARRLGGGGHRLAAGYTSSASNVERALAELKKEIISGQRGAAG